MKDIDIILKNSAVYTTHFYNFYRKMATALFVARLLIVHVLYFLYSAFLWVGLWRVAADFYFEKSSTLAAMITWFCFYVAINVYLMVAALKEGM